ncbi:MAG: type IV pilus assembly protein PilM [Candidatus Eisenbacteria bacterium]
MVFSREKTCVGLDIGSSSIKAVELERRDDGVRVVRFGETRLPPDVIVDGEIMDRQAVVEAVRELFASCGITRRRVVAGVHGRGVIVKKITMDRMGRDEASEAIFWEAEQHVPYDLNDVSLDFQILDVDMGPRQMQVLLVAAKRDLILNRAEIVREAGLILDAVDVHCFALHNLLESCAGHEAGEVIALLNVGADTTNLIVARDHAPLYTQDLAFGGTSFLQAIQKSALLSREEAERAVQDKSATVDTRIPREELVADLSASLDKALNYLRSSGEADRIDRILVSGGGAHIEGLVAALSDLQSAPVAVLDPLSRFSASRKAGGESEVAAASLAVGIGLALRKE